MSTTALTTKNGTNAVPVTVTQAPKSELEQLLWTRRDAMAAVLPKHLTPDRLIKIASVAVSKSDLLKKCTPLSVLTSVMTAAQLGLDCGGALGSAYLVPFKKNKKNANGSWDSSWECQLIIGYRGLIDLARRSGQIVSIEARIVYQNDDFSVDYAMDGVKLRHKPCLDSEPGPMRLVYGIGTLKDGGHQFELMTKAQVDKIRAKSMAKDNGPWVTDYEEMARKTVVKRLAKYLPIAVELADAVTHDNRNEFGTEDFVDGSVAGPSASSLNDRLKHSRTAADRAMLGMEPAVIPGEVVEEEEEEQTNAGEAPEPQPAAGAAEPAAGPAGSSGITDEMVGTWDAFYAAMEGHAASVNFEGFAALMKALPVHRGKVKSSRTSEAMAERRAVLEDFHAGRLGADGKTVTTQQ